MGVVFWVASNKDFPLRERAILDARQAELRFETNQGIRGSVSPRGGAKSAKDDALILILTKPLNLGVGE